MICRVSDARSSSACMSGAFDVSMTPARAARSASPCRGSPVAEPAIPTACAPRITPSPWRWAAIQERTWPPGSACRSARRPCCAASARPISIRRSRRVSSASMTGAKARATARSSVILSAGAASTCCPGRDPGRVAQGPSIGRDRRPRSGRRLRRGSPPGSAAGHSGRRPVASAAQRQ